MAYVPLRKALAELGLHPNTLRRYADQGLIPTIRNPAMQRDDLARQVERLRRVYPDADVIKAKRIRLYPTLEQKTLFRQWLGTSRTVYNETVKHLSLPKEERGTHWMGAAKCILASLPDWAGPIPYQIKKIAVEDAYKARPVPK